VSTPGHNVGTLQDSKVRMITERALLWAARR
jgi:type 1 glutamine amidotransferase